MARNKGMFKFAANFEVKAAEALDPRVVVDAKADLINKETWPYDGETLYLYKGLVVGVAEEGAIYMLTDATKALETDYSGWKQLAAGASQISVIDNVSSSSTTDALSANQGRVLNEKITTLEEKLTAIFTFKGPKTTVAELPEDGSQQVGDVWHVNTDNGEYVWDGDSWELLGLSVDLSTYATKTEVSTAKSEAIEESKAYTDEAKSDLTAQISNKVDKVAGSSLVPDAKISLIDQNASNIAAIQAQLGDGEDAGIVKDVEDLKTTVGTAESGLVKDVNDLKTQLDGDQVRAIDTTASHGVSLAAGTAAKSVKVTVVPATLAGEIAPSLNGTLIKVGQEITEGATISADATIADAIDTLADAIQTAQAGGITTIGSTGQTITVSGGGNTRNIDVNVANIVKASNSSLINDGGKLDLVWIEVE